MKKQDLKSFFKDFQGLFAGTGRNFNIKLFSLYHRTIASLAARNSNGLSFRNFDLPFRYQLGDIYDQ